MFLDTTFCIDLMREQHRQQTGAATQKLLTLGQTPLQMSLFVLCELQAGARLSRHPEREIRKVERLAERLEIIYPDEDFAVAYGETEALLRSQGVPIPTMDLLIGVTAKMRGVPLLSRDRLHLKRIPGLVLESY
jgi:tRNA(fMet)-specific endonuclease VapC